jgi:recombination protein RecA
MALREDARALMAQLNKQAGDGVFVMASDMPTVPRFPTGSLSLDVMLGGGWPGNQWHEIVGTESSGKTTIVHKTVAANQQRDPDYTVLWVAAEGYDAEWATTLGVDTSRVIVHVTNAMEDAYTAMIKAADSRAVDCVVLDSYPALVPDDEAAKEMGEATISVGARLTGKFFRKVGGPTARSMITQERPFLGLIINQYRDKIGSPVFHGMVPQVTPGGHAKDYAYYCRVEVKRTEWLDEARADGAGKQRVGQVIKLKTLKNKAAAPQQVASVNFYFANTPSGFRAGEYDGVAEVVALGVLYGVIEPTTPAAKWFRYGDEKWNGKPQMIAALREEYELVAKLRDEILHAATKAA